MERLTKRINGYAYGYCGRMEEIALTKRYGLKRGCFECTGIVDRLAELEDELKNGTLVEISTIRDFINDFIDYLLKSEAECGNTERENIEACIYQEVFQMFARKVEKQLGIKVFEEEHEND